MYIWPPQEKPGDEESPGDKQSSPGDEQSSPGDERAGKRNLVCENTGKAVTQHHHSATLSVVVTCNSNIEFERVLRAT